MLSLHAPVDILILSNGPGEVTTWVRPVVQALRQRLGENRDRVRISVMLSPCPHAMGQEAAVLKTYAEVDRVQGPEVFWDFLLWGKTAENWDWRHRGVVIFLGGDQFFPVVVARRLNYATVVYAEWEARWPQWVDFFGVRNEKVGDRLPRRYQSKVRIVGDLMVDVGKITQPAVSDRPVIGLLPGSKPHKLSQGVPFTLAIADSLHRTHPQCQFRLFVAPTVSLEQLAAYGDPDRNPMVAAMGNVSAQLINSESGDPYLLTHTGLKISLCQTFPALEELQTLTAALTTVGANTAQLGALAVPMIVLLPTQHLEAMRHWDGLPGLVARSPLVGTFLARLMNYVILRQKRLFAWPNLWAGREIVPELVGTLTPDGVAQRLAQWLDHPEHCQQVREELEHIRGPQGAAIALTDLVVEAIQVNR